MGVYLWGVANYLKAVQIDEDQYAYPPTEDSQNLEGKLKQYPPPGTGQL